MKKIYTIMMAVMVLTASYAQPARSTKSAKSKHKTFLSLQSGVKDVRQEGLASLKPFAEKFKAPRKESTYDVSGLEIITEQPAGTVKEMKKTSTYFAYSWGEIYYDSNYGSRCFLIEGTDGAYYINDPFTGWPTNSWLKLEKEGDELVAKLPQAIYHMDASDGYDEAMYYAFAMEIYSYEKDSTTYHSYRPTETQEYRFTIKGDSIVSKDPSVLLALGDKNGGWYAYGDLDWTLIEFSDKTLEVSDAIAASAQTFALTYTDYSNSQYGYVVSGAFDGQGNVYVKGAFASLPDVWIKGTFDGKKAVFPSGQFMGYNDSWQTYSYFEGVTYGTVYDEYYDEYYYGEILADSLSFDVDLQTMTMTTEGGYLLNANKHEYVNSIETINYPSLSLWAEKAGTPQDPEFIDFGEYDEEYGWSSISTYLPIFDTDSVLMDYRKVTYKFYLDDDVYTLNSDDGYVNADGSSIEPISVLPYDYLVYDTNGYSAIFNDYGMHYIYLFFTGYDKFGIQTTYTGGGETHSSNIVYHYVNGEGDGIKGVTTAGETSVSYTDLLGRKVSKPSHGLYIKSATMSDGTVKTKKVIVR